MTSAVVKSGGTLESVLAWTSCVILLAALPPPSAAQQMRFTNASSIAGIATDGPAQGVAVTDVDRDGYDDVFFAAGLGSSTLFMNNGNGTFRDATTSAGLVVPGDAVAPVWVDVNNDGAADLFVGIRSGNEPNRLFLNDGNGVFEDAMASSGVDPDTRIGSATFGDYDQDGLLDLFLATRGAGDRLYRNVDGVSFEDVTQAAGVAGLTGSVAMQATWVDFDRDGDLDLFAVHDGVDLNRLYRNDGVFPFVEIAEEANIDQVGSGNGMGVAWFDSDLDGHDDVYVTRIGVASLYRNRGDGSFDDVAVEAGVERNGLTWGVVAADFDNDGDDDLFMVNTHSFDGVSETFLYRNVGGVFTNVARNASAALKLDSFGVATGDFNADGLIDIVITSIAGDNRLLINASQAPGNWVGVEARDESSGRLVYGTAIRLVAGGVTQRKSLFTAQGYCSQNGGRVHFGVGSAANIDTLEILWPEGASELYTELDPNKTYVLRNGVLSVNQEDPETADYDLTITSYPNPFQSNTNIEFTLERDAEIQLVVLDLLGRRVKTLASGLRRSGSHTVTWSVGTEAGRDLPAGVYLIHMQTGDRRLTRAVVRSN